MSGVEDIAAEALAPSLSPSSEGHLDHHDHSRTEAQRRHTTSPSPKHAAAAHACPAEGVKSCLQCGSTATVLWRRGPLGPETLCNACGVKFLRHQQKNKPGIQPYAATKVASPQLPCNSERPSA